MLEMRVGRWSKNRIAKEKRKASVGERMNVGRKGTRKSAQGEIRIRRDPTMILLLRETNRDGGDTDRDRGLIHRDRYRYSLILACVSH